VKDAEKLLRRLIGEDVALETSLQPRLRKIKADPVQLEQILLNLTVNSRDAMPQGGQLLIETCNIDLDPTHSVSEGEVRAGPYVMLAISDTGHGMDSQTRSRIFEPFFTTKERGRGTGLGLSTVYGIVQQSGGYIWVYSEPGHGTSFKIYLPECRQGHDLAPQAASRPPVARGNETLLLVEDEAAVRSIAKRMLEGQGYRVLDAGSGSEAVELSAKFDGDIHLLVTDVVMPGMSGRQLAEEIQLHRPRTRILYLSGYTDNTISYHGVLQEGVAFMQKPFSQESLASKVREVLDAAG
jgi:CheY-like chemotaxis protein